jgi:hydrogenase nickel incorporation protein HypA/HybF
MHELSLTQEMLHIALEHAEKYGAKKILSLKLKIGAMSMLDPECFRFYFDEFSKNTIASGALLDFIKSVPEIECSSCNRKSKLDDFIMTCPLCNSIDVTLLSGQEILLEDMEVEL